MRSRLEAAEEKTLDFNPVALWKGKVIGSERSCSIAIGTMMTTWVGMTLGEEVSTRVYGDARRFMFS